MKNYKKQYVIALSFIVVNILYIIKLFFLQVIDIGYQAAAEKNIIQKHIEKPYRGLIYDTNGKELVYNDPVFDILCIPNMIQNFDLEKFCICFKIKKKILIKRITQAKKYSKVKPYVIIQGIPKKHFALIQEKLIEFPGFIAKVRNTRKYTYPILANTIGYIGKISKEEKKKKKYCNEDWIGKTGIEKKYDSLLRGKNGLYLQLINAQGIIQGKYKGGNLDILPTPGQNIITTINTPLQLYGKKLLQGKKGSIVALVPSSGEVLAIVSSPSYNPKLFSEKYLHKNFHQLLKDKAYPLFHRPIMAMYPPGSIFKPIQALIGLNENIIDAKQKIFCNTKKIKCHPHPSPINLQQAIQYSCNPYFYNLFKKIICKQTYDGKNLKEKITFQHWRKYVLQFGLGKPLGIDLPGEKGGNIPTAMFYDTLYGKDKWKHTQIRSLDIGQGEILVTPLQIANIAAIIANRGFYYTPYIVKKIGEKYIYSKSFTTDISKKNFEVVVEAMHNTTKNIWRAQVKNIAICCKTGTVENTHGKDHAVFMAFAPKNSPQIAVAVYIENAGWGARSAAAIGSLIIEKYMHNKISRTWIEKYVLDGNFFN